MTVPSNSVRDTRRPPCSQETRRPCAIDRVAVGVAGGGAEHLGLAADSS